MLRTILVGAVVLASATPTAHAICMATDLAPEVLTSPAAKLPADGGVLVGWTSVAAHGGPPSTGDPSQVKRWTYAGAKVAIEPIAPGLTRYRRKAAGDLTILDGKATIGTFVAGGGASPHPSAPAIKGARFVTSPIHYGEPGHTLTVTLADPVPDGVVAIVAYDAKNVAISFGRAAPGATELTAFTDAYRCTFNPPGTAAPKSGEKPSFAYVDQFGRVSKVSAPVAVTIVDNMPKKP